MTYPGAVVHYARSVACQESTRGIATVVKPNRPADIDARGSGAAGAPGHGTVWAQWAAETRGGTLARAGSVGRARRGARTHIIYDY